MGRKAWPKEPLGGIAPPPPCRRASSQGQEGQAPALLPTRLQAPLPPPRAGAKGCCGGGRARLPPPARPVHGLQARSGSQRFLPRARLSVKGVGRDPSKLLRGRASAQTRASRNGLAGGRERGRRHHQLSKGGSFCPRQQRGPSPLRQPPPSSHHGEERRPALPRAASASPAAPRLDSRKPAAPGRPPSVGPGADLPRPGRGAPRSAEPRAPPPVPPGRPPPPPRPAPPDPSARAPLTCR